MAGKKSNKRASGGEVQVQKSPAEFFAENQAIAGFDNMGKSLYTSIRELMENSLDACESIGQLPDVSVEIEEFTQAEFNVIRGLHGKGNDGPKDTELFQKKKAPSRKSSGGGMASSANGTASPNGNEDTASKETNNANNANTKKKGSQEGYFRITVRDNGCGMHHDDIPNLLGRVLSGSKYGVRQTRGKFGLGSKMCLIWSKKSTGVPIKVTTAHRPTGGNAPSHYTFCELDIDIYKNEPRIMEHKKLPNKDGWIGTQLEIIIAGNWTTYKSRIVQYLQQLAIITPYAKLEMTYTNVADTKGSKNMSIRYDRRSEQMPPPAQEVKHHPSSVNNLLIQQLQQQSKTKTLVGFLSTELSAVPASLAKRLIAELGSHFDEDMHPSELTDKHITRLVQLLRSVQLFKPPDGSCLSPLGEYNLNLGIRKVLEPTLIATARDKAGAYEGHPFIVEAAVSLGGKNDVAKEGLTVVRFANRIPLLFEGGADVSTRVAQTKIKWSNYKIDHKRDKVGVFVSIVSTKVPYKGTGKEYIGDDITEIQQSVRRALLNCCNQLKAHLAKRNALRDIKERKSRLIKYIPDVGRALFGLLDGMRIRKRLAEEANGENDDSEEDGNSGLKISPPNKKQRLNEAAALDMIRKLDRKEVTEESIKLKLRAAIDQQHADFNEGDAAVDGAGGKKKGAAAKKDSLTPLFLVPANEEVFADTSKNAIHHPLFTFRPYQPVRQILIKEVASLKNNDSNDDDDDADSVVIIDP